MTAEHVSLGQLRHAGREPALPMTIELAGEPLQLQRWLRVLPGRRYVGVGLWQGRRVFAKLLVGRGAERHFQREREGVRLLVEQGLETPRLLAEGCLADGGWLLFDYLEGSQSLAERWQQVADEAPLSDAQQQVLGEALGLIAGLHAKGLWQSDLHLDNLLAHDGRLYLVDGGGVQAETPGQPLSREQVLRNLGVFFAQLPATLEPFTEELLVYYLLANGEHALPLEALLRETQQVRRWRLRDYLRKAGRDCSLFSARIGAFGARVLRRSQAELLAPVLDDPDAAIASGRLCKGGGTATIAEVERDGSALLVKRYNIKGIGHWLSRFWRPSRAWHSWIAAHRLELLGIATARPLAVRENRWLWLRGKAWLVTEFLQGQDAIRHLAPYIDGEQLPEAELQGLENLFAALRRERISHGDLKGHNLFWDRGRWTLIDLDAMRQHRGQASFERAYARDRARFLRNWPETSRLYKLLDERLPLA
jgi:tRNA A-37 threonylcarbamoyl transferase component Bud32